MPRTLFERPKRGFGVPIGAWRRGQLCDWAETLLDEHRIAKEGYLQPTAVRTLWQQHLSGPRDCPELLWHVLMFQRLARALAVPARAPRRRLCARTASLSGSGRTVCRSARRGCRCP
jgi:hypothetical protein